MLKKVSAIAAALLVGGLASADPITPEDWEKYPAISRMSLSWEGDFMVGIVHEPGTGGMKQAVASWDLSGDIDTSKPLAPSHLTPGNERMRMTGATALKGQRALVLASQAWTGRSAGCLEGVTTGANKTFLTKAFISSPDLEQMESPFGKSYAPGSNRSGGCDFFAASTVSLVDMLPLEEDDIMITRRERSGIVYYKHNLQTGRERVMFRDSGEYRAGLLDSRTGEILTKNGFEPIAGLDYRFETQIKNDETGRFEIEDPLSFSFASRINVSVIGRDDLTGKYYVLTDKFRDMPAIYFYDAVTNKFDPEPVFAHPDFEAAGIIFGNREDNFNRVLGFQYDAAYRETYWIDPEMKSIQEGLNAIYPDLHVIISDWNQDMSKVLYTTSSERHPTSYYLLLDKSRVAVIGNSRPWIEPESLGKMELVYYTARDGMKIPAFLTYPAGWKEGDPPAPAIVSPHGGPWVRDFQGMDFAFVQPWASNGYFVLQPQYRGSQGFGRELWLAGDNQWGLKMQDDKDDGAAWMVENGWVAEDRIAIMGYSYGGYAAMAAAVRPDSPYQCAIAGAGVSNLAKLGNRWSNDRLQRAFQGHTVSGMDPIQNVEEASIPILVIHGDRDVRVPLWHGRDYYNAIKDHTDATFYEMEDSPHGFPWPQHRREWIEQINSYLENDCGPGGL